MSLYLPEQDVATDAAAVLARAMSPPPFPIGPGDLLGDWSFTSLTAGHHSFEGFDVLALDIPHKGGRTFGYRISDGSGSLAYLSDHSPIGLGSGPDGFGPYHPAAMQLAVGVDLLLHDAQHTAEEFESRRHFGHSTVEYAVGLAHAAQVGRLMLFHHDPSRTDEQDRRHRRHLRGRRCAGVGRGRRDGRGPTGTRPGGP